SKYIPGTNAVPTLTNPKNELTITGVSLFPYRSMVRPFLIYPILHCRKQTFSAIPSIHQGNYR
ncbi:MAG TPA: hypothetical protein VLY03_03125, partial [Bacteroidota bacterium]|nr:hypothetical protein [Bacteroidota bacterium]